MTELVSELERLPEGVMLDGELVAWGRTRPPRLSPSRPQSAPRRPKPVCLVVLDVLAAAGRSVMRNRYSERRALLDSLDLNDSHWRTAPSFDHGETLWREVCRRRLEGVVAKR